MGGIAALRDVIVVGFGPAGAGAAAMLAAPEVFAIAGQSLDVLAFEARSLTPTRMRTVGLQLQAQHMLGQVDDLLGSVGAARTAPEGVATIEHIERSMRAAAARAGVEIRYDARIAAVRDGGRAGVEVELADGSVARSRFLIDATGGRLGPFTHGAPTGETIYLTGQLPPMPSEGPMFQGASVSVHGAGNDRVSAAVFGFNDAREGATAFVAYPSMPPRGHDATLARRMLRSHLEDAGVNPHGLRDAAFIRTPHVRTPSAVDGSMIAIGDSVRRVTPRSATGVSNALLDARDAAWAVQSTLNRGMPRDEALAGYAIAASRR